MSWYANQKARHESSKERHDPAGCTVPHCNHGVSLREQMANTKTTADRMQEKGGAQAREGEMWFLPSGESVIIRKTALWKERGVLAAHRVKVKVRGVDSGKKLEVLASQLSRQPRHQS
jgi:hypothetical protein